MKQNDIFFSMAYNSFLTNSAWKCPGKVKWKKHSQNCGQTQQGWNKVSVFLDKIDTQPFTDKIKRHRSIENIWLEAPMCTNYVACEVSVASSSYECRTMPGFELEEYPRTFRKKTNGKHTF